MTDDMVIRFPIDSVCSSDDPHEVEMRVHLPPAPAPAPSPRQRARIVFKRAGRQQFMNIMGLLAGILTAQAFEDDKGRLTAIIDTGVVAEALGCHRATVQAARNGLQHLGLISVEHRGPKLGLVVFNEEV